jgi:hypothetical protein
MPKKLTDAYRVTKAAHARIEARSEMQKQQIAHGLAQTALHSHASRVILAKRKITEATHSSVLDLHHMLGDTHCEMEDVVGKARRPIDFFDMPGEVRNLIYGNKLDLYAPSSDFVTCMLRYENVSFSRLGDRYLDISSIKCRHDTHDAHWPRGGCWLVKGGKCLPRVWLLISKRCSAEIETLFHSKGAVIGILLQEPLRWLGLMELTPPMTKLKNLNVNIPLSTRLSSVHGTTGIVEGPTCVTSVLSFLLGRMVNLECMNVKISVRNMSELEEFRRAYCSDTIRLKADKFRYLCPMLAALKCETSMEFFVHGRSTSAPRYQTIRFEI